MDRACLTGLPQHCNADLKDVRPGAGHFLLDAYLKAAPVQQGLGVHGLHVQRLGVVR